MLLTLCLFFFFQVRNGYTFVNFAQIKHRSWVHFKAVLTSTHNLCFGTRKKKACINVTFFGIFSTFEPPHGKTNNLPRQKQRRRSASQ